MKILFQFKHHLIPISETSGDVNILIRENHLATNFILKLFKGTLNFSFTISVCINSSLSAIQITSIFQYCCRTAAATILCYTDVNSSNADNVTFTI